MIVKQSADFRKQTKNQKKKRGSQPAPHERIMAMTVGLWQSRALAIAAELELADHLAGGPLSVDELAARSKANPAMLQRLLRALESVGIFQRSVQNTYGNTEISDVLRKGVPGSQWAWVRSQLSPGYGIYELWAELGPIVRTGEMRPEKVLGQPFWGYLQSHSDAGRTFDLAMQGVSQAMTPAVTAAYDWSHAELIADVGGGIGTQLIHILENNPTTRGVLFDQQHVLTEALQHDRMQIVSGDFFQSVPADADVYLIRTVLHDWNEEKALSILTTVRKAARPGAKLVIAEIVLPEGPEFALGKWSDSRNGAHRH